MPRLPLVLALLAGGALAACRKPDARRPEAELPGRGEDPAGGFLVLVGRDTLAAERYTRTPGHLRGTIVHGDHTRIEYDATVADDEAIVRLEMRLWPPGAALDSKPAQQSVAELGGPARDSLPRTSRGRGPERVWRQVVPGGTQPYLVPSLALAQQLLRHARVLGGDSAAFEVVVLNGSTTLPVSVRWLRGDTALIAVGGRHVRVGLDAEGRIEDGADSAAGVSVRRLR